MRWAIMICVFMVGCAVDHGGHALDGLETTMYLHLRQAWSEHVDLPSPSASCDESVTRGHLRIRYVPKSLWYGNNGGCIHPTGLVGCYNPEGDKQFISILVPDDWAGLYNIGRVGTIMHEMTHFLDDCTDNLPQDSHVGPQWDIVQPVRDAWWDRFGHMVDENTLTSEQQQVTITTQGE